MKRLPSYDVHVYYDRDGNPRASCTAPNGRKTKTIALTPAEAAFFRDVLSSCVLGDP